MAGVVTVPELLDGHTALDVECLDRIYLNGYVPALQVGGQVIGFLHDHLGMRIASPAVLEQIGTREARGLLSGLAERDPAGRLHREAKAALARLEGDH